MPLQAKILQFGKCSGSDIFEHFAPNSGRNFGLTQPNFGLTQPIFALTQQNFGLTHNFFPLNSNFWRFSSNLGAKTQNICLTQAKFCPNSLEKMV